MLSTKELSYEQEVCNILKETTIRQRLEEVKERTKVTGREHGFNVCSDGRVTKVIEGSYTYSDLTKANEECNYQIDIQVHSHPDYDAYPSRGDLMEDLNISTRIASCVYGVRNDKVTCYRTSDELRNKYIPLIDKYINELNEIHRKYDNTTDQKEKDKLYEEWFQKYDKFEDILMDVTKELVSNAYPELKERSIAHPYKHIPDSYDLAIEKEKHFGNFRDVWIKDCGKI
ncbi:MAG: hypothetical protein GPW18_02125 [Euryarchaeota archaeon]|nr:hypothetical protein [Euryarchaeota archaeon]